ncbi:MAG: PDZ domain-containing protein [Isosphaeraceae bacterium]|nr:PDZ domain-containing protein [Isosphaeraceae bacterium]
MTRRLICFGVLLALVGLAPVDREAPEDVGKSYQIPYRLTQTNHYLVRVRINGKGPFNFLVDSGAPALYVGTETARKVGLKPDKKQFWTRVDRLDLEGGATLKDLKARVEDPFQLVGMNALGLPGASIDGILGFTILARFKLEFDPTRDRMTWTRLDYEPKDPPVPARAEDEPLPAEFQLMQAMGPMMKLAAVFIGKQPEDILYPRGRLGLELAAAEGVVTIKAVLPGTPAAEAGLKPGDILAKIGDKEIATSKDAHAAMAKTRAGDRVRLVLRRGGETLDLTLTAAEGL